MNESEFWARINKTDTCWIWHGATISNGYGQLRINGKRWLAHRYSYFLNHGSIDPKLPIDHLCETRLCVKPEHLEQVTTYENNRRVTEKITHCPHGHEYTEENTWYYIDNRMNLHKRCKVCIKRENSERKKVT